MKIKLDNEIVLDLNETKKKVIKNDINEELFEEEIKRRLHWVLTHKYEQCLERLKKEWTPRLKNSGVKSIPLDDDEFAELVFSQSDYKNRSQREAIK